MKKVELTKAILSVMAEVKGIEKNLTVGSGQNTYKGVSDKDVKQVIGKSMTKNGLSIIQIGIEPTIKIDRWEETNQWGTKMKQSVFTEVKVNYLLMHESGESMEIVGYGHGVDSQDKSAGKATTYALKYALLYTFLVPTGAIDDADNSHSDETQAPPVKKVKPKKVSLDASRFDSALKQIELGKYTSKELRDTFTLTKAQKDILNEIEEAEKEEKKLENELEKVAEKSKNQQ